jgi:hypothetical protein
MLIDSFIKSGCLYRHAFHNGNSAIDLVKVWEEYGYYGDMMDYSPNSTPKGMSLFPFIQ